MSLKLSDRCEDLAQAEIRAMSIACESAGGINLAQGVCDTEVPKAVTDGVSQAFSLGVNSYTRYDGLANLRRAIARKLAAHNGIKADPETEIVVSAGTTGAFYCACLALLNPGDEVILFEPYYGYHVNTLQSVEAVPAYVPMRAPDWAFSREDLEKAITPRTRAIMVNTPGNPSGKVFTREELELIGAVAAKHDLFIFTDEIYEYFVYDGRRHISPASIPALADRTITIAGFSKTYGITGWRIGYSVCAPKWAQMIGYMNDLVYVCAPAPLQHGVAVGLEQLPASFYQGLSGEYAVKRNKICRALEQAGLAPFVPQGAYYILADVSRLPGATSKERAMYLLRETGVATVPGDAFFQGGRGRDLVRLCFAKTDSDLDAACERLSRLKSTASL